MITFLPSTDFDEVARCLDDKRLGAQRYEAWSILKWLRNPDEYPKLVKAGYCVMWVGYEDALVRYTNAMLNEWAARGKNNELLRPYDKERKLDEPKRTRTATSQVKMPPWLGTEQLHSYHRHALVSKFPGHYQKFGWSEDGKVYNGSYLWPVRVEDEDDNSDDNNGGEEKWVLRWPKWKKLPAIPISVLGYASGTDAITMQKATNIRRAADNNDTATARNVHRHKKQRTMRLRSGRRV
uniref:Uncharacterized protein n=1 Tax=Pseudo-nitzschia australis TaxID=44445 RepID=A0A7S4A932_9STRA